MYALNNIEHPEALLNLVFDKPMPGDFVEVIDSVDHHIPIGSFGVILGHINCENNEYNINFNSDRTVSGLRPADKVVHVDGGVLLKNISAGKLSPTSVITRKKFKTKFPYHHVMSTNVKVWTLDLLSIN